MDGSPRDGVVRSGRQPLGEDVGPAQSSGGPQHRLRRQRARSSFSLQVARKSRMSKCGLSRLDLTEQISRKKFATRHLDSKVNRIFSDVKFTLGDITLPSFVLFKISSLIWRVHTKFKTFKIKSVYRGTKNLQVSEFRRPSAVVQRIESPVFQNWRFLFSFQQTFIVAHRF